MEIDNASKVLLHLLKGHNPTHTVTSLAKHLKITRTGTWKILKKLEKQEIIHLEKIGGGKTSTSICELNWENPLTTRTLAVAVTKESLYHQRWIVNFSSISEKADFLILFGSILHDSKKANDIDLLCIAKKKHIADIDKELLKLQKTQEKKIHATILTGDELKNELKQNNTLKDAMEKGVLLAGQEKFISYIITLPK